MPKNPWHVLYDDDTGQLLKEGPLDDAGKAPFAAEPGASFSVFDLAVAEHDALVWDAAKRAFVTPTPTAPPRNAPGTAISKLAFLRRIGMTKLAAVMAQHATDPVIQAFQMMFNAADIVHVDDVDTVAGIEYMASQGILSADDVLRVLAPPTDAEV